MTLRIDGTEIDFLYINEELQSRAYVDGTLVHDGPNLGEEISFGLTTQLADGGTNVGYILNLHGDLQPREFRSEFIEAMYYDNASSEFVIRFDSASDLGQNFFYVVGILLLSAEYLSIDATYTFTGTQCIWKWPSVGVIAYNTNYAVGIFQKKPLEIVTDFTLLPGTADDNITVGYTSAKYISDIIGDLDPPTFKNATVGALIETGLGFYFGFEDDGLPVDYWRTIEIPALGLNLNAADAVFEPLTDTGTFWRFDGVFPNIQSGVNYFVRIRGVDELLFAGEYTMIAEQNAESTHIGFGNYAILDMGSITPPNFKGIPIYSVISTPTGNAMSIGIGFQGNLPQGYWDHVVINPGNITLNSIDFLFNEYSDSNPGFPNNWEIHTDPIDFVAGQTYSITFYADNNVVAPTALYSFEYSIVPTENEGLVSSDVSIGYRENEISRIVYNEKSSLFAIIMSGPPRLKTYWRTLYIKELGIVLKSEDMIYDRFSVKGKQVWYTYENAPVLKDGELYSLLLRG